MTQDDPDPMPANFKEAFRLAFFFYLGSWSPAVPDTPQVSFDGKFYPIGTIFSFMTKFTDPMPEELLGRLVGLPGSGDIGDGSYGAGARYLLGLMRDRKDRYDAEEAARQG